MLLLKNSITIRSDSLYCPLCLSLDSYSNCLTDCHHCYLRRLNAVWGNELKPADVALLDKRLTTGVANKKPRTPLAHALARKKTIRWGNKSDPFQTAEREHRVSREIFSVLIRHRWSFVIQTKFTGVLMEYERFIMHAHHLGLITVMPVVSPGGGQDWLTFERSRTTQPELRLAHLQQLMKQGVNGGVNGEPFIPGYHTVQNFEDVLKLLKSYNIHRYNTYNFHWNEFTAKRLHSIGVDIERIWFYNQDAEWRKILPQLLNLTKKYNIIVGCPDFVNSGRFWVERANTCCGVDVPNPCTFNTHYFKKLRQDGHSIEDIINMTNDGTGDMTQALQILRGEPCEFYTLKDAGL